MLHHTLKSLIALVLFTGACNTDSKPLNHTDKLEIFSDRSQLQKFTSIRHDVVVKTLDSFYREYMSLIAASGRDNQIKTDLLIKRYTTTRLYGALKEENLDYDPFTDSQDMSISCIKTLVIKPVDAIENAYLVCYKWNNDDVCIQVKVIEQNGSYKIDELQNRNPDLLFIFPDESSTRDSVDSLYFRLLDGVWALNCNSYNDVGIGVVGAQFHFPKYTINSTIKQIKHNEYHILFRYPVVRPIPTDMEDCRNYAEDVPIAKIKYVESPKSLIFEWYGYYNRVKKVHVHQENPFDKSRNIVTLKPCKNEIN